MLFSLRHLPCPPFVAPNISLVCKLVFAVFFAVFSDPIRAQNAIESTSSAIEDTAENHEAFGFRAGSFVAAPIPFQNPTIGAGLALGGGYLFDLDEGSTTSYLALGGMKSDNGTNGYGITGLLAWDKNRWQVGMTLAEAEAFYDLYVAGLPIPLRQEGQVFKGYVLYGPTPQFSFGPQFQYLDTTVNLDTAGLLPPSLLPDSNLVVATLGAIARYDTRDNSLYPRSGMYLDSALVGGWTVEGASREYAKGFVNFALYRSFGEQTVLATQVSTCATTTDAPFFDQCALGNEDSFRGFSTAQYYDYRSLSVQVELRRKVASRIGVVAFAGAGATGPDYGALDVGGIHAAGGIGLRFQLSKKFETDFSIDATYNDEESDLIYVYVGQRF